MRWRWLGALLGLQALDLLTTWWALSAGAEEGNPVVNALGWWWTTAAKIVFTVVLVYGASKVVEDNPQTVLWFTAVLYIAIAVLNAHTALTI